MKRLLLLFIIISVIGGFAYSSCDNTEKVDLEPTEYSEVNQLAGVSMQVNDETITPTGLTLFFENSIDTEFTYGQAYLLEVNVDGEWYQAPEIVEDYGFEDIGYILPPNGTSEWSVDWEWLYGELDSGEYRIIKDMLDAPEPGNYEAFPLAAEFVIEYFFKKM